MSGAFVKIYGSILRSSIWQQPLATKVVWITILALADGDGVVETSVPGLAATAGVTISECEAALACFMSPDPYSGSNLDEGRRIRPCRGGFVVTNHRYYRELRTERQIREAVRIASKRAQAKSSNMSGTGQHVANIADVAPEAEAEAEREISSDSPSATADAGQPLAKSDPGARAVATRSRDAVSAVFECWQREHGKQRSRLDAKRAARIKARLGEGFTVEQLCQAIRGAKRDEFLMGHHSRARRAFDGLDTLLRDAAQVERLIALEEGPGGERPAAPPEGEAWLT